MIDLSKIKERLEGTSDGPWEVQWAMGEVVFTKDGREFYIGDLDSRKDAQFIAHARTDVPALVAEVERLQELLSMIGELTEPATQCPSYLIFETNDDVWEILDRIKAMTTKEELHD